MVRNDKIPMRDLHRVRDVRERWIPLAVMRAVDDVV